MQLALLHEVIESGWQVQLPRIIRSFHCVGTWSNEHNKEMFRGIDPSLSVYAQASACISFPYRPVAELDISLVPMDATFIHEHCMPISLGVGSEMAKSVLDLRSGSTENGVIARALLAEVVEWGLPSERAVSFIIDGAKSLLRAIAEV